MFKLLWELWIQFTNENKFEKPNHRLFLKTISSLALSSDRPKRPIYSNDKFSSLDKSLNSLNIT